MGRVTIAAVNAALATKPELEGVTLRKGNGYFYFSGGDTGRWNTTGVYVYHLRSLSVDEWVNKALELRRQ